MRQFIPTLSGSDLPLMCFRDQITIVDFAVLPASLYAVEWKQFTHSKKAIYKTVKRNYLREPFSSSSPFNLAQLIMIGELSFLISPNV